MALNIKNAETEKLVRELARRRVQAIVDEVAKLPVLDDRSADEIIGYNDQGHFD